MSMKCLSGLVAVIGVASFGAVGAGEKDSADRMGAEGFRASPERPVGWLGDWHGRYAGAHDFPLEWAAPKEWSEPAEDGTNILWKTALPGWGHSSPVYVSGRIFLTCEPDVTVGLDAETGKVLWKHSAGAKHIGSSGTYHYSTGWTMGTVCSDGKSVFANHFNGIVICYDLDGNVRWRKEVPPLGWCAASPLLVDGILVVIHNELKKGETAATQRPNIRGPYEIAAYKPEDGAPVWRNSGTLLMNGWHYNGLTPFRVGGRTFLVSFCGQVYDGRDGKLLMQLLHHGGWGSQWLAAVEDDTVVLGYETGDPTSWRRKMIDLKVDGVPEPAGMERLAGWVEAGKKLQAKRPPLYQVLVAVRFSLGSDGTLRAEVRGRPTLLPRGGGYNHMLVDRGFLYFVQDGPRIRVVDLKTNEPVGPGGYDGWVPDGVKEGGGWFFSHAVVAGDSFMVSHWNGLMRVFRRAPDFTLLASNPTRWAATQKSGGVIGSPMNSVESAPCFSGDRIFCRHWDALYCIGDRNKAQHEAAFAAARQHGESGRTKEALDAYRALWRSAALHVRYRALKEMGLVLGANAIDGLCEALRHEDPALRSLAVSIAAGIPGDTAASGFAVQLKDSDPKYRQQILAVLGQRGDRSASDALVAALDDGVAEVRQAAIGAVRRIGGPVAVKGVVARLARFSAEEREEATAALVAMPEPETEETMAALVPQAAPLERRSLIRALGSRGATGRAALILADVRHADRSVRIAALGALAMIGGTGDLTPIVARARLAGDAQEREAVEGALLGIFNRTGGVDAYVAAVQRGMAEAQGPAFASLVRVLGPAGGKAALVEVRKALGVPDLAIHGAAIEAMASWPDVSTEIDLMKTAKTERDATNREEIVRGLLRMIDLAPDRPADKVFALYEQAIKMGRGQAAIVAHLSGWKDVRALELAASLMDQKGLEETIVNTISVVAPVTAEKEPAKTIDVLNKLAEGLKDANLRGQVNDMIKDFVGKYGSRAIEIPIGEGLEL